MNDLIYCKCGCGKQRNRLDSKGNERLYIAGHQSKLINKPIRYKKVCANCGQDYFVIKSRLDSRVCCSIKCNSLLRNKDDINRFWKYVDLPFDATDGDCWLWKGGQDKDGYGVFGLAKSVNVKPHRFSFEKYRGKIPNGLLVCHTCDTPSCINPSHLFVGTHQDNVLDCHKKGRSRWQKC